MNQASGGWAGGAEPSRFQVLSCLGPLSLHQPVFHVTLHPGMCKPPPNPQSCSLHLLLKESFLALSRYVPSEPLLLLTPWTAASQPPFISLIVAACFHTCEPSPGSQTSPEPRRLMFILVSVLSIPIPSLPLGPPPYRMTRSSIQVHGWQENCDFQGKRSLPLCCFPISLFKISHSLKAQGK